MISIAIALALLASVSAQGAASSVCQPSPAIRAELTQAARVVADPSDFDKYIAPLLALRKRYPNDLIVHESYQGAVQQHGIEGHLRKLTEDYQVLAMQHPDDLMYSYLYARSLIGRNTPSAIQQINQLLEQHPDFAPAHGSLAEIYSSAAFRDAEKEKVEQERYAQLCPGLALQQRPGPLPEPTPSVDQAERVLAGGGDPEQVVAMARQGIRDDEWRLQRIRPFDWYSVDYKRQAQRDLQVKYWKMWSIEVRCDRRAGHTDKAVTLLAAMDQRAASLAREGDPIYWNALAILAHLYEEGDQKASAIQKLDSMQQILVEHPDPQRSAQLADLRKQLAGR